MSKAFPISLAKYALLLMTLLCITVVQAQPNVDINTYSDGFIPITSYQGITTINHSSIQMNLRGNSNLENWTLTVRITNPIRNSEGKIFPADKIAMRINHIEGSIQGITPTITTIGANPNPIFMQQSDVNLIQNSPLKLVSPAGTYNQVKIVYDIIIAGGSYLQNLKSWQNYTFNGLVTLRNAAGNIVSQDNISNYSLQVMPTDSPPIETTYGIEVNINAKNSILNLKTISDYVYGTQVQYDNALKVIASTPYSIQVRSTSSQLTANQFELPIGIIKLSVIDSNTTSQVRSVDLSTAYQTIYQSNTASMTPKFFHLKYATPPNDSRLLEAQATTYTTTLIYTLTPQ